MPAAGFKRFGLIVAGGVVVLAGAFATAASMISADSVREAVKAEVRALTGLELTLRGEANVSLFPQAYVSFADVALSGDRGAEQALVADRLMARLEVLPLLVGRAEIADVTLIAPTIRVEWQPDGRTNWSALAERLAQPKKPERLSGFSEIRIERGTVRLTDAQRRLDETADNVELSLAWPSISRSFGATGRFTWRDEPIDVSVALGDFTAALSGARSTLKMRLAGKPMKAAFDGAFSLRPTLKIDGTLAADAPSLRNAMAWSGLRAPPGGGLGRFALKAQSSVVGGTVALTGVNLELDGNAAEGVITYASEGRQALQATLAADKLDFSPYVSTIKLSGSDQQWDSAPIDLSALAGFDLDLRLSAARATLGTARLDRTAIAANLRNGNLLLTIGESQAFGGAIKGSVALAKADNGADVKTSLQFSDVNLEACLGDLFGLKRLEGKGNLAFALEGKGNSVQAITRTLNGTATLTSQKGAINGLNVEQLLRRLERRPLSGGGDFRSGRTAYDTLAIRLKVAQGIINTEDAKIEGPAVSLSLTGTASIPARDLDLKGIAALTSTTGNPGFELPFVMQGSWQDPLLLPDPQALIKRSGAAAPLLDAVKSQRGREAIRSAIERFTGGLPTRQPAADATPASTDQ
jgi:AsmA protein